MTHYIMASAELIQKYQSILTNPATNEDNCNGVDKIVTNVEVQIPKELTGEYVGSSCKLVTVTYKLANNNEEEGRIELFVKEKPNSSSSGLEIPYEVLFKKEGGFFNEILTVLKETYVNNAGRRPLNFFPKCLFADENEIVLENLTANSKISKSIERSPDKNVSNYGYFMNSKIQRQDVNCARLALEKLAQFHALSFWILQEEKGLESFLTKFPYLSSESLYTKNNLHLDGMAEMVLKLSKHIIQNFSSQDINSERQEKALDVFNKYKGNVLDNIIATVDPTSQQLFKVLTHGDFWNNNMLFLKKTNFAEVGAKLGDGLGSELQQPDLLSEIERTGVSPIVIIDFQAIRIGSPNLDLLYYFFTSLDYETRHNNWESLLKLYFEHLKEACTESVIQPTPSSALPKFPYTFDEFLQDYKFNSFLGFWFNIMFYLGAEIRPNMDYEGMKDHGPNNTMEDLVYKAACKLLEENLEKAATLSENLIKFCEEFHELNNN